MAGLPVLASELVAVKEVINSCGAGRIVSSLAPADVGAAISAMLEDQISLACMRCNALEATQGEFCWDQEKSAYSLLSRNQVNHH